MMMVTTGGKKSRLPTEALGDFKTQHAVPEREGAVEVGNFEVNVADAHLRVDR